MFTIVDVIVVGVFLYTVWFGVRIGIVTQLFLTLGLLAGCCVAAFLQGNLAIMANAAAAPIFYWPVFTTTLAIIALFFDIGWSLGAYIERQFQHHWRLQLLDRLAAGALAGATALLCFWLTGVLFLRAPDTTVAEQVKRSFLLSSLRTRLPNLPTLFQSASNLVNPHSSPQVFAANEPAMASGTAQPITPQTLTHATPSIVRVDGTACGNNISGTGFVVNNNVVVTVAHVVAGVSAITVTAADGAHAAQPLLFDPELDIAILQVPGLDAPSLKLNTGTITVGQRAFNLGYRTGKLTGNTATIISRLNAVGYDIYNAHQTERAIYAINAPIEPGNSGGPLLDGQGAVIGVIFAKSPAQANVGYALALPKVAEALQISLLSKATASTGQCGSLE